MAGLLLRGMLVGLVAGLLAFGFARLVGEPQVDFAIAFETHAHSHAQGHSHGAEAAPGAAGASEPELVSRATQAGLGLFTGMMVYAAAIGGVFAIAFAIVYGRVGRLGPRGTAALVAAAGFTAFFLVPWLKYPANPPSVGSSETIGLRTELYFIMVVVSVMALVLAAVLGRMSAPRLGGWTASLLAAAAFLAIVGIWGMYLPAFDEVPEAFPATLLWNFRLASLGIQAVLWSSLGILFGLVAARRLDPARARVMPASRPVLH